jgi:hypothetical protein
MKIQDQVCRIDQAKRLSQLDITQGLSAFFWDDYEGKQQLMMNETPEDGYEPEADNTCFSAFTVTELFAMLPASIPFVKKRANLRIVKHDACEEYGYTENYTVGYYLSEKEPVKDWVMGHGRERIAEAAADMLIMLIEQKKITPAEVNERLNT